MNSLCYLHLVFIAMSLSLTLGTWLGATLDMKRRKPCLSSSAFCPSFYPDEGRKMASGCPSPTSPAVSAFSHPQWLLRPEQGLQRPRASCSEITILGTLRKKRGFEGYLSMWDKVNWNTSGKPLDGGYLCFGYRVYSYSILWVSCVLPSLLTPGTQVWWRGEKGLFRWISCNF